MIETDQRGKEEEEEVNSLAVTKTNGWGKMRVT
jgi:hypothetical protein